jgi:membrane peptidoglycan carboxypeptidase
VTKLTADRHRLLDAIDAETRRLGVPAAVPPLIVQKMLVFAEDRRNRWHVGVDPYAIGRAAWQNVRAGAIVQGASTIEQQLVRVLTERFELTFRRKLHEVMLAIEVALRYPKATLVAVYLRRAYFGFRMTGYFEACRRLAIDPHAPSRPEAALLIACIRFPLARTPRADETARLRSRAAFIERQFQNSDESWRYTHLDFAISGQPSL